MGMMRRTFRGLVYGLVLAFAPVSLLAADTGAMLYAKGEVTVDGHPVTDSTAVLPGSVIETKPGAVANLNASGTTVMLQPETLLKFTGTDLYLDHGGVTVASSSQMQVHVKCVNASPLTSVWTQFSVADVNGTVQVAAMKNAVGISYGSEFVLAKATSAGAAISSAKPPITVSEGQQYNHFEMEGCPIKSKPGAQSAAAGGIFSSPVTQIGIAATGAGIVIALWPRSGSPVSPTEP
jgi:hypothetical protein